jgi:hypothetical protein
MDQKKDLWEYDPFSRRHIRFRSCVPFSITRQQIYLSPFSSEQR